MSDDKRPVQNKTPRDIGLANERPAQNKSEATAACRMPDSDRQIRATMDTLKPPTRPKPNK